MGSCCNKSDFTKIVTLDIRQTTVKQTNFMFVKENTKKFEDVYKAGLELGVGSYGVVRKAVHRSTGIERAVKIFKKSEHTAEEDQESLRLEIRILRDLDHPNIVRLHEFFEDETRLYLVMDNCEGGELFQKICTQLSFGESQVSKIIKQLLSAVSYLHHNKIVHRDIKPENILFEESRNLTNIKLIDFGLASQFTSETPMEEMLGSLFYIAPEVIKNSYNEKCDIWSIGVITYILVLGELPYFGLDEEDLKSKILENNINYSESTWENISEDAKDFIQKLLCNESSRLTASQALEHPWILNCEQQSPGKEEYTTALQKLKSFQRQNKLKEATKAFIISQCTTLKEIKEIRSVFQKIDKNSDGKISKSELIENYSKYFGNIKNDEEICKIIEEVEGKNCEEISYFNFLNVCLNDSVMMNLRNLKYAFNQFDLDGNGKLSIDEIRTILNSDLKYDEETLLQIMREADKNGDGEIDFEEFSGIFFKIY